MRALAALLTVAACANAAHAHDHPRALLSTLGLTEQSPLYNLYQCTRSLGAAKCVSALSAWRAENAIHSGYEARSNLVADVKDFPWNSYSNVSDDALYSQLCDSTEKLLRYRSLELTLVPGYRFNLESKGNGTLNIDVLKNDASDGRSSKKMQKQFYKILPMLIVPGLIMSAILPFVLPALKLMTVGVGIINNMALSGAVFTLLRNNAFNERYEKKVIYLNDGYENEKHSHIFYKEMPEHSEVQYSPSDLHAVMDNNDGYIVEEYPTNEQWMAQYYGSDDKTRRSEYGTDDKTRRNQYGSDDKTIQSQYGTDDKTRRSAYGTDDKTRRSQYGTDDKTRRSAYGTDDKTRRSEYSTDDKTRRSSQRNTFEKTKQPSP